MILSFAKSMVLGSVLLIAGSAFADCTYSFDPTAVHVGWTAYKTTAKIPVHAEFKTFNVQGSVSGSDIPTLLNSLRADVATDSVMTGNPTRDTNILAGFFKYVKGFNAHGRFLDAQGDAQKGTLRMVLGINGKYALIPMTYVIGSDNLFTASGTVDLLKLDMSDALNQMNTTCAEYHTGADGVSKTWSTVDLALTVPVTVSCTH